MLLEATSCVQVISQPPNKHTHAYIVWAHTYAYAYAHACIHIHARTFTHEPVPSDIHVSGTLFRFVKKNHVHVICCRVGHKQAADAGVKLAFDFQRTKTTCKVRSHAPELRQKLIDTINTCIRTTNTPPCDITLFLIRIIIY